MLSLMRNHQPTSYFELTMTTGSVFSYRIDHSIKSSKNVFCIVITPLFFAFPPETWGNPGKQFSVDSQQTNQLKYQTSLRPHPANSSTDLLIELLCPASCIVGEIIAVIPCRSLVQLCCHFLVPRSLVPTFSCQSHPPHFPGTE